MTMILSIVRTDFREFLATLRNWIYFRRMSIRMGLAIRLADMKQRAYNKQYHVLIMELPSGAERLFSLNNREIESFKRKRWLPKHVTMLDLRKDSIFYSTPLTRNNRSTAQERRAAKEKYLKYSKRFMK